MRKGRPQRRFEALLVDLDGTLINLEPEKFVPAYLKKLSGYFSDLFPPEKLTHHLLTATRSTILDKESGQTNESTFYADFCHRLQVERPVIDPLIEKFYEKEFPQLRSWGTPRPGAREMLTAARLRSLKLVLATQPVFPRSAVIERLAWGKLSEDYFDLITTMENMHYCKPHPEYYLEISEKIGISPEQCLMAGNDTFEDISATKAGMGTFLVEGAIIERGEKALPHDYRGTLADLATLIKEDFRPAVI